MKKRLLFIILLSAFNYVTAYSQESTEIVKLVKEKNEANKFANIKISPFGLLLNSYDLKSAFMVSKSITIGPILNYTNGSGSLLIGDSFGNKKTAMNEFGFGLTSYYFFKDSQFDDSWFLNSEVKYITLDISVSDGANKSFISNSTKSVGSMVGYQWYWSNGFNISLGLGIAYVNVDMQIKLDDKKFQNMFAKFAKNYQTGFKLNGEVCVGFAF